MIVKTGRYLLLHHSSLLPHLKITFSIHPERYFKAGYPYNICTTCQRNHCEAQNAQLSDLSNCPY